MAEHGVRADVKDYMRLRCNKGRKIDKRQRVIIFFALSTFHAAILRRGCIMSMR